MITTALTSAQGEILDGVSAAVPIAAVVFATLAGIGVAFKLFKKVTGAR